MPLELLDIEGEEVEEEDVTGTFLAGVLLVFVVDGVAVVVGVAVGFFGTVTLDLS